MHLLAWLHRLKGIKHSPVLPMPRGELDQQLAMPTSTIDSTSTFAVAYSIVLAHAGIPVKYLGYNCDSIAL